VLFHIPARRVPKLDKLDKLVILNIPIKYIDTYFNRRKMVKIYGLVEGKTMRYTLKQLSVFEAIAQHGSVSLAAERLSLTQSATSMSLAQLEKILGRPLFERQGKQMALTYWGVWLLPKAKRLLQDAKQIETGFYEQQSLSGSISICTSQTPAEHLIPELVCHLDSVYPELQVVLGVKSSHGVIEDILGYRYDLGVIEGRCDHHRLAQETWCSDRLVIVASTHHPLAKRDTVSMAHLEQAKWILRDFGSGTRSVFDSAIYPHIQHLDVWREYEFVSVIRNLVSHGAYLTCLPYLEVKPQVEAGQLTILDVPELKMERTISFVWRADMGDHPLIECVKREGLRMMKGRTLID
jgi:DNA-binding transcriptional LysR family regulator